LGNAFESARKTENAFGRLRLSLRDRSEHSMELHSREQVVKIRNGVEDLKNILQLADLCQSVRWSKKIVSEGVLGSRLGHGIAMCKPVAQPSYVPLL